MYLLSPLILSLSTLSPTLAYVLTSRAIGGSCSTSSGTGTCQYTSDCTTQGFTIAGACPGPADIQCCIKKSCSTPSGLGICQNKPDNACSGTYIAGYCPGSSEIQCCVSSSTAPPPPSSSSGSGSDIVAAAVKEEGLPYVWGGGGCNGPSSGGFDCSGLTQYAICTALDKEIPRTADTQYHSSLGTHLPRSEAEAGDLVFWGEGGDCESVGAVKHVGVFIREGWMVNAAHTGTPVREESIWTSSGGESICPDAVRFW